MSTLADVGYEEGYLSIPPDLSYEDWVTLGGTLKSMERNVMWWLGSWYNHGAERHAEKFSQALDSTGYTLHTIQNAATVEKRFPSDRREAPGRVDEETGLLKVPFFAHAEVVALEDDVQDQLLDEVAAAIDAGAPMTREHLRAKVRHLKAVSSPEPETRSWTMACNGCNDLGPNVDCVGGRLTIDHGYLCQWLNDHFDHDVQLLGPTGLDRWMGRQVEVAS
jgi:hypothetical protein